MQRRLAAVAGYPPRAGHRGDVAVWGPWASRAAVWTATFRWLVRRDMRCRLHGRPAPPGGHAGVHHEPASRKGSGQSWALALWLPWRRVRPLPSVCAPLGV